MNQGSNGTFSVTVSGSPPFSYQWLFNSNAIAGATAASYTLNNIQYTNGGNYSVTAANSAGSATSPAGELIVRPAITSVVRSNAVWLLNLNGTPGKKYGVESSGTLTNWNNIGSVTNSAVPAQFSDPSGTSAPGFRGYRLKVLP